MDLSRAFGLPTSRQQFPGPVEAKVNRLDGQTLYVELLDGLEVAVRWSGANPLHLPPVGTACLVVFAGGDLAHGWAVAFDGWRP